MQIFTPFLNRIGLLLLGSLFLPIALSGQTTDLDVAKQYLKDANDLIVDSAKFHQAIEVAQKAQTLLIKELGPLDTLVALSNLTIAEAYSSLEDYNTSIEYYLKERAIYKQLDNVPPTLIANNFNNIGMLHEYKGDYEKAFSFYQKSIPIYLASDHELAPRNLAYTYNNLAICYNRLGNYHKALQYLNKTLQSELDIFGRENLDIASTYNNIGLTYKLMGDYEKALELLNKSLQLRLKFKDKNTYRMARLYDSIGLSHYGLKAYEKALQNCQLALSMKLKTAAPDAIAVATPYENIGKCLRATGDFENAKIYLEKALNIRQNYYYPKHYLVTNTQVELAELELQERKTGAAIERMETRLQLLKGDAALDDFKNIPKPIHYLSVLKQKGRVHWSLYKELNDINELQQAAQLYETAISLIEFIRTGIDEEASKQVFLDEHYNLFGQAISIYYDLWQQTKETDYIKKAFDISEKGKSSVLLEAVQNTYAKDFAGIPSDLLDQERQLKVDIAYTEKQRFSVNDTETDEFKALNNQLFDLKVAYETLIEKIEKKYPSYYQLKYNTKTSSVESIQDNLVDQNTSMVSYFITEDQLFSFVINQSDVHIHQQKIDIPLRQTIKVFVNSIADYPTMQGENKVILEALYVDNALALYELLIQPIEDNLQSKLILIPHDLLSYVPFECLLKERPENTFSFRTHRYLLHDYQMSYTYSASLLQEMHSSSGRKASKQFVGFAPLFETKTIAQDRRTLGKLTMNIPEVQMIESIIKGDLFINESATESNFVNEASDYQIIHLATHGIANDQAGDFCYLAFSEQKDSIENEYLYTKELYPLRLNADMVVLSACETARGEFKTGEGLVSIARGFSYAGAKSIITTLWSINDATTAKLMQFFYENIRSGVTKDAALCEAQRQYLKDSRDQISHPVYWAAFIPVGNMSPIELSSFSTKNIGFILLAISLIGGLFLFIKNTRSTSS